jgi:hypothetical protein
MDSPRSPSSPVLPWGPARTGGAMEQSRLAPWWSVCLAGALLWVGVSGCVTGGSYPLTAPARPARDVPERFVLAGEPVGAAVRHTLPGSGCRSPLVDPRDGSVMRLVHSGASVGDYEVPAGRYGVGPSERLRLDCNTGRVIGIVPQRE